MASTAPTPLYDSASSRRAVVGEFIDLIRYRDLLAIMVANITKSRYKRSVLGMLWTLMNPLLSMTILTIAFSTLFRFSLPNYPVYVLSGLVCWNFFTTTTLYAMNSLIWGGSLLKRIYIPRTIYSVAAVGNGLTSLGLAMVPLLLIMLFLGHPLRPALWVVPFAVVCLAAFALGISLLLSSISAIFTDFIEFYQALLQALFFLVPIMYPLDILPDWTRTLVSLNPMFHLIEMFRAPIYYGRLPDASTTMVAVAASFLTALIGWVMFTRRMDELPYRI